MPRLVLPVLPAGALSTLDQPVLDCGAGLALRPWQAADVAADVAAVVAGYADPAVQRWHCRSMDAGEAAGWIASWPVRWQEETGAGWAIVHDGAVVGQISLRLLVLATGFAEVSYWVLPAARGQRFAPRALTSLTSWALTALGLHRVELAHSTANPASCRVAERAGFTAEGTRRAEVLHADGWHDMHQHARLDTDASPPPLTAGAGSGHVEERCSSTSAVMRPNSVTRSTP